MKTDHDPSEPLPEMPNNPAVVDDPDLAKPTESTASEARENAFLSVPGDWNGIPLRPYSSGRESLFSQLRHQAGAPPVNQALDDIDAFFPDAIRILWLCTHDPADWRQHRRDPGVWQEIMEQWADDHIPLARKGEAIMVAMNILTEAYTNRHEPVSSSHAAPRGN